MNCIILKKDILNFFLRCEISHSEVVVATADVGLVSPSGVCNVFLAESHALRLRRRINKGSRRWFHVDRLF